MIIIRTQDKNRVLKCEDISYHRDGETHTVRVEKTDVCYDLGGYSSKARCMEVLGEIWNTIKYELDNISQGKQADCPIYYAMPKE